MFETNKTAEIDLPEYASHNGCKYWKYIKGGFNGFWLYVIFDVKSDDGWLVETFYYRDIFDVLSQECNERYRLKDIYLVSPGSLNNSDSWKMDKLLYVYKAEEPGLSYVQDAFIFFLQDGSKFTDSALSTDINMLVNKSQIYPRLPK